MASILQVPDNFLKVIGCDGDDIEVELTFYLDVLSAVVNTPPTLTVQSHIYGTNPLSKHSFLDPDATADEVIDAIIAAQANKIDHVEKKQKAIFATHSYDITSVLSNAIANKFNSDPGALGDLFGESVVFEMAPGENSNVAAGGIKITPAFNPAAGGTGLTSNDPEHLLPMDPYPQDLNLKALALGLDPAGIYAALKPAVDPMSSMNGAIGKSNSDGDALDGSFTNANDPDFQHAMATMTDLSQGVVTATTVTKTFQNTVLKLSFAMIIPTEEAMTVSDAYFAFSLTSSDEDPTPPVEKSVRKFNIQAALNEFFTPDMPPSLQATYVEPGNNSLAFTQVDPVATKVIVYRRVISPDMGDKLESMKAWETYGEFSMVLGQTLFGEDMVNNSAFVMYRAQSIGPFGHKCPTCASAIVTPGADMLAAAEGSSGQSTAENTAVANVVMFADQIFGENFIRVSVFVVAQAFEAMSVVGRMMQNGAAVSADFLLNPDSGESQAGIVPMVPGGTYTFDFKQPGHNMTYEFYAMLYRGDGTEPVRGSDNAVITYRNIIPGEQIKFIIGIKRQIGGLAGNGGASRITNMFFVDAEIEEPDLNFLIDSFTTAGADTAFLDEVKEKKSSFGRLVAMEVVRRNLHTGEEESFGVQRMGKFVDSYDIRNQKNIMHPFPGYEYDYTVKIFAEQIENFFEGIKFKEKDPETGAEQLIDKAKYFNEGVKALGTLPSNQDQLESQLNIQEKFFGGQSVHAPLHVPFSIPGPEVPEFDATKIIHVTGAKNAVALVWVAAGNTEAIGHFDIYVSRNGASKQFLKQVYNMDIKNTWSIGLPLQPYDVGRLEYSALVFGHPPTMTLVDTISWDALEIDKSDTENAAEDAKSEQHHSPVSGRVRMPIADINRTAEVRVPQPCKTRLAGRPKPPRIRGGRRDGG